MTDTDTSTHDWAALRRLAEAATPGPWEWPETSRFGIDGVGQTLLCSDAPLVPAIKIFWRWDENRAFAEAAHPAAVLALLDRRDAMLKAAVNALSLLRVHGLGDTHTAMSLADAIAKAEGRTS